MKFELKQLGKDSVIYGIGDVFSKAILFLLLPVYTRIFAPAEFGAIETLTIINTFLGVLLMMGMDAAQSFYFFEQKNSEKAAQAKVISAILQWRIIWGSIIVILATFLSPLFNRLFFNGKLSLEYFIIAFVGALFLQFMAQSAEVFRLLYRPLRYIAITLGYAVIGTVISLTLVIWFGWDIKGHFIGFGIGAITAAGLGWYAARDYLDFSSLHRRWWPRLLKFGLPFLPAGLGMYVLNTTDRWFIIHYHGQGPLGIYAVGAKFVILILVMVNAFRTAWWPISLDVLHKPEGPGLFRTISRLYLGLGIVGVITLTSLSPLLMKIFSGHSYHSAYPIVGILSWYAVFYGFFLVITAGIWKSKRTSWIAVTMAIAVLINIVLDFFLVPQFGGIGAAVATSISFFIWNLITLIVSEKLWPVNYPVGIFGLQIGVGIIACWWILSLQQSNSGAGPISMIAVISSAALIFTSLAQGNFAKIPQYLKSNYSGKSDEKIS